MRNDKRRVLYIFAAAAAVLTSVTLYTNPVQAAACELPGTDYGVVTMSASVSATGTYRVWTRMAAPNSTDTSYRLEIDGTTCYQVGGSNVPTYATGTSTHFVAGTSNWIRTTTTGETIDVALAAGSHELRLIGISSGVVVDRVIITADTTCVPISVGDNCAGIYVAADINTDMQVNFLDFSLLAGKFSQSGAGLGRSDINSDGTVNFLDYSILASKFGQ